MTNIWTRKDVKIMNFEDWKNEHYINGMELYDITYLRMLDAKADGDNELAQEYENDLEEFDELGKHDTDVFFRTDASILDSGFTLDELKEVYEDFVE